MFNNKFFIPFIVTLSAITIGGAALAYNMSKPKESKISQNTSISSIVSATSSHSSVSTISKNSSSTSILSSTNSSNNSSSTTKTESKPEDTNLENQNQAVAQEVANLNYAENKATSNQKLKVNIVCDQKSDDYGEVLYSNKGCFYFSTRIMCDFDKNSEAIKELRNDLNKEAIYQFAKLADKILDIKPSILMQCAYTRTDSFKFSLILPDRDYIAEKFGSYPEAVGERFIINFEAKKENGKWTLYEGKTKDVFENWKPYVNVPNPPCPFTQTNINQYQYIERMQSGCFNINIYNRMDDSNPKINDFFRFQQYFFTETSRLYFDKIAKELDITKEIFLSVDNIKFINDSKIEFTIDTFGAENNIPNVKSKYIKYYTAEEKTTNMWEVTSIK